MVEISRNVGRANVLRWRAYVHFRTYSYNLRYFYTNYTTVRSFDLAATFSRVAYNFYNLYELIFNVQHLASNVHKPKDFCPVGDLQRP